MSAIQWASLGLGRSIHESEAKPLPTKLGNSKHTSCALEALDFFAAAHGRT